jgi:hypothetical protein
LQLPGPGVFQDNDPASNQARCEQDAGAVTPSIVESASAANSTSTGPIQSLELKSGQEETNRLLVKTVAVLEQVNQVLIATQNCQARVRVFSKELLGLD